MQFASTLLPDDVRALLHLVATPGHQLVDEERRAARAALNRDDLTRGNGRRLVFVRQGDRFAGGFENGAPVTLPVTPRQRRGVEALHTLVAAKGASIPELELLGVDTPEAARGVLRRAAAVIGVRHAALGRALAEGVHLGKEGARFELDEFSDSADVIRFA